MLKIIEASDLTQELQALYDGGLAPGESTGWHSLDEFYTVQEGFWTVVTGVPSHGKSTWIDNLMLNLIREEKTWRFLVYSPENQPVALHMALLVEKLWRRPFRAGYNNRILPDELLRAVNVISNRIKILQWDRDASFPNIFGLMEACNQQIADWHEKGYKVGIIIDPWNELDHSPLAGQNETQWTNHELMCFRQWVRDMQVHGWIVAHPQKPQRTKDGKQARPTLYDINGSAAWYNKADMGIIVHRRDEDETEIEVGKCRFKHLGKKGSTYLRFNAGTGSYYDI